MGVRVLDRRPFAAAAVVSLVLAIVVAIAPPAGADGQVTLVFTSSGQVAPEGSVATVSVAATAANGGTLDSNISVDVSVAGASTATDPDDYTFTPTTLNWASTDPSGTIQDVTVTIADDALAEGRETVRFVISGATGGADLGSQTTHNLRINDDDGFVVSFGQLDTSSAESGTRNVNILLDGDGTLLTSGLDVIVTPGGSATGGGVDYTLDSPTVTFPAGSGDNTPMNADVTITADTNTEPSETVTLTLSIGGGNPDGVAVGVQDTHTITISDNDAPADPPELTLHVNVDRDEGQTLGNNVLATFTDTDPGESHTATVDWDDGTMESATVVQTDGSDGTVTGNHAYADDRVAPFEVEVCVDDNDNGSLETCGTFEITVANVAPTVTARTNASVAFGANVVLSFGGNETTFTDPGTADTHTAEVDWDDGTVEAASIAGGNVLNASNTYLTEGLHTVTVTVTDDDGGVDDDTFTVTVGQAAVAVNAGNNRTINENGMVNVNATFDDADEAGNHTAQVDLGDGRVRNCPGANCALVDNGDGTGTVSTSFRLRDDTGGPFTVTVTVDEDGGGNGSGEDSFAVTVNNVAPTASMSGPFNVDEGRQVRLTGTATDPGKDDTFTYQWRVTKNGSLFKTGTSKNLNLRPDDDGSYVVRYTVTDDDGGVSNTAQRTITGHNVDPQVVIVDAATGTPVEPITDLGVEGRSITLGVDITDPGSADTFTYDWEVRRPGNVVVASGDDPTITFESPDDGSFFVFVTVADDDGGEDTPDAPIINVVNAPPVINRIVTDPTPSPGSVGLSVVFSDPGSGDTHVLTIDWGEGSLQTRNPADSPEAFNHTFASSGVRRAEACVEDDDGGGVCVGWYYNVGGSLDTSADYDGDGREDLATGVPGEDSRAGGVAVIYGAAGGLNAAGDQFLRQGAAQLAGDAEAGDQFGAALAHGDFNGDGRSDLAVGAPGEALGGANNVGNVTVINGAGNGLRPSSGSVWHQDRGGVPDANEAGDRFGAALAAGDFNGDGFGDLAVGAPGEDVGTATDTGRATVIYGSPSGLRTSQSAVFDQNTAGANNANSDGDGYGTALAAGDFNGDGFVDLAIGVPGQRVSGSATAGGFAVLFGSVLGLTTTGDQFLTQNSNGVPGAAQTGDEFGAVLAAGDMNGDGRDDLVLGTPSEGVSGNANAGSVTVLRGSASGVTGSGSALYTEGGNGLGGAPAQNDLFGSSIAVGDVTGDGRADLLIGIPNQRVSGARQAGTVVFIRGSANLGTAGSSRWHEDVAKIVGVVEQGDHLGAAVAVVDTNGNGRGEVVIGIPDQDRGSRRDAGAVLVLVGTANGPSKNRDAVWTQDSAGIVDTSQRQDRFGGVLSG